MRLPYAVHSHALSKLRAPSNLFRNGSQHLRCKHDVAILGGGITGLTAAYRLSKDPSCSKVTIYEKGPGLGGWIQSERIPVDGGDVVFEYGPRTLRLAPPASFGLLDLVCLPPWN